ncbi:VOC family protein [Kribbella sp. NPDC051770]|uniref:VOC family protein n=1 Tax=Kribbella sp. NPDC051770 TaxID=3155413 RepID=UPI00342335B1
MNHVVIRPLRFTADVAAMRGFLETLGLAPRVEGTQGGWVDLMAGNGMVALHDAASSSTGGKHGDTRLTFEADTIDELRDRLVAAGYDDATTFDEAYGRVLSVTGPGGVVIWIDERSEDLYGYRLHESKPDERLAVRPRLLGAAEAEWMPFLELLGARDAVTFGAPAGEFDVRLELWTSEPLAEVAARLPGAELQAQSITLIDPDGQPVQVHA